MHLMGQCLGKPARERRAVGRSGGFALLWGKYLASIVLSCCCAQVPCAAVFC